MPRDGEARLPAGGAVAWREWGDPAGRPVVFLHGTPGSRLFAPDPDERDLGGVRLITFDRPGYGRSTPASVPSLRGVAAAVGAIADELGLERFAVIGFSGGGPGALACGARLAGRVSRIGFVAGSGPIDELEDARASLSAEEQAALSAIRADPPGATSLLWTMGQWFADDPLQRLARGPDPADAPILGDPRVRANLEQASREGALQAQAGLIGDWVAEALPWGFRLEEIAVPVDVWVGGRDPGRARLDAPELARRIPSCVVHADPGAGHWLVVSRWADILERSLA